MLINWINWHDSNKRHYSNFKYENVYFKLSNKVILNIFILLASLLQNKGLIDASAAIKKNGKIEFNQIYFNFGLKPTLKNSCKVFCKIKGHENMKIELEYDQIQKFTQRKEFEYVICDGKHSITIQSEDGSKMLNGFLYVYQEFDQIVIVDVDGTLTISNKRGHLLIFISYYLNTNICINYWSHKNVVELLRKYKEMGYKIVYLSSRPQILNKYPRYLLENLEPNGNHLPDGQLIVSEKNFFCATLQELTNSQNYKANKLKSLKNLGLEIGVAFGNTMKDKIAYKEAKIDNIFIINKSSVLSKENKNGSIIFQDGYKDLLDSITSN